MFDKSGKAFDGLQRRYQTTAAGLRIRCNRPLDCASSATDDDAHVCDRPGELSSARSRVISTRSSSTSPSQCASHGSGRYAVTWVSSRPCSVMAGPTLLRAHHSCTHRAGGYSSHWRPGLRHLPRIIPLCCSLCHEGLSMCPSSTEWHGIVNPSFPP